MSETEPRAFTNEPVTIIGRQVRTNSALSVEAIPMLWSEVTESNMLASVPGRVSDDVYAVYTNLEDAGVSNAGYFSFIIGVAVAPSTPVPTGMVLVSIPRSPRLSFAVPSNDPSRVVEAWEQAWAFDDRAKTFTCEYELYAGNGEASVNLGVHPGTGGTPRR